MSKSAPSLSDHAYQKLKADLSNFKMLPGDRFSENEAAERLQMSRTPIRQALFRLQQEGLVEVQFRSGWLVKPFDFEQFEHLYDLRVILETSVVKRLSDNDISLSGAADKLQSLGAIWLVTPNERLSDEVKVSKIDEAFHTTLISAAGNPELTRVHRDLTERIRVIRKLDFTKQARIEATYDEHGKILKAILSHRGDQASLLIRSHIESSKAEVRKITMHQLAMARRPG